MLPCWGLGQLGNITCDQVTGGREPECPLEREVAHADRVVHHDPRTAFGQKLDVSPPQPAACASHNRDLPRQRNSFGHLASFSPKTQPRASEPGRSQLPTGVLLVSMRTTA